MLFSFYIIMENNSAVLIISDNQTYDSSQTLKVFDSRTEPGRSDVVSQHIYMLRTCNFLFQTSTGSSSSCVTRPIQVVQRGPAQEVFQ